MKIINLNLKDSALTIELEGAVTEYKVYLDAIDNKSNMYSLNDEDHTLVTTYPTVEPEEPIVPDASEDEKDVETPDVPTESDPEQPEDNSTEEEIDGTDQSEEVVIISENVENTNTIITFTDLEETAYIVTVITDETVRELVYDKNNLYHSTVSLLTSFCNTCLDKHQKEKIMLYGLKSQLFDYAMVNDLLEDSISYYTDICRLLDIPTGKTCCKNSRATNCIKCRTCVNGCCSL